jgi:hypothetical protein
MTPTRLEVAARKTNAAAQILTFALDMGGEEREAQVVAARALLRQADVLLHRSLATTDNDARIASLHASLASDFPPRVGAR